jgi:type II secretory pathway pseudopilin PulG
VKPTAKQPNKRAAFTIVELLTVMSIIIILMGLLAPAMNRVRRYARRVNQKNQFHSIDVALELFRAEFDGYPDSGALDGSTPAGGVPYCGAMKLAEAMVGQDLLGFHPDSRFLADGTDGLGNRLYYFPPSTPPPPPGNLEARKEHSLPLELANAYKLNNIYSDTGIFATIEDRVVLCDVYTRVMNLSTGKRIGMPILYYKANTSNSLHDVTMPDQSIYNYLDNHELVRLGMPWNPPPGGPMHKLFHDPPGEDGMLGTADDEVEGEKLYIKTINEKITSMVRPYRVDSYILLSAGYDGQYGTRDDVFNFGD